MTAIDATVPIGDYWSNRRRAADAAKREARSAHLTKVRARAAQLRVLHERDAASLALNRAIEQNASDAEIETAQARLADHQKRLEASQ